MKFDDIRLVEYTRGEEAVNTVSHLFGLVLSCFICISCVVPSVASMDTLRIVTSVLYLFGTTVMFVGSAVYHGIRPSLAKRIFRVLDHCMIFFAVAGTATGCVPAVFDTVGLIPSVLMTVCAWVGAFGGLVLTLFSFEKTKALRMALYIGTALVCALCGGGAYRVLPGGAFSAFLGGSTLLLIGTIFYALGRRLRYIHGVFHVFILFGLFVYYLGISAYCY